MAKSIERIKNLHEIDIDLWYLFIKLLKKIV